MRSRPVRPVADRLSARRWGTHSALQLAVRPQARRRSSSCASRTPTPSAHPGRWSRASSTACDGSVSTGTKARTLAGRTRLTSVRAARALSRPRAGARHGGRAYPCYCTPEELQRKRSEAEARAESWRYDRACLNRHPERWRASRTLARRGPSGFACPPARRASPISSTARLRSRTRTSKTSSSCDRTATHLSPVGGGRRCRDGDQPRRARRRSHLEHAEAGAALRGVRRAHATASRTCR